MTNGTLEIEMLEGIDLEGAPPCDARIVESGIPVPCPQPSVARIRSFCPDHGLFMRFACNGHLIAMKHGIIRCGYGAQHGMQFACMNVAVYKGDA